MSMPSIPKDFTFTLGGGLDVGMDDIRFETAPGSGKITTDSKIDAGLDNIRIRELPKIELELGMKPTRVHSPSHYNVCFSILGMEMFKLGLCGESMVITEPYVPRATERCR
jgi:hypothetical protein